MTAARDSKQPQLAVTYLLRVAEPGRHLFRRVALQPFLVGHDFGLSCQAESGPCSGHMQSYRPFSSETSTCRNEKGAAGISSTVGSKITLSLDFVRHMLVLCLGPMPSLTALPSQRNREI